MLRDAISLLIILACTATIASANNTRPRIITRRSAMSVPRLQSHDISRTPAGAGAHAFDRSAIGQWSIENMAPPNMPPDYQPNFYWRAGPNFRKINPNPQTGFAPETDFAPAHPGTNERLLPHVMVIQRQIVEPAAVVSRALSEQPVHPHLIEVLLLGEGQRETSTIYLDPLADYEHQGSLVLDENHFINRAQRLGRSLRASGAYIIRSSSRPQPVAVPIRPHLIFRAPNRPLPRRSPDEYVSDPSPNKMVRSP